MAAESFFQNSNRLNKMKTLMSPSTTRRTYPKGSMTLPRTNSKGNLVQRRNSKDILAQRRSSRDILSQRRNSRDILSHRRGSKGKIGVVSTLRKSHSKGIGAFESSKVSLKELKIY